MLTDEDIIKLKSVFGTKEDFSKFATKEDLSRFATKEDLSSFATKNDILGIRAEVDIIAKTTAYILENMATKKDISDVKAEINDIRMDLKSFKKDTEYSIKEVKDDFIDLNDTGMLQDKRIEKLENKVFA